ncbi:hypothetical protein FQP34_03480 [Peribacillus simplex]|uniref:Uncharacterized protein n=1 Tax=Peribacillus simplex TaxID=1478 RepID=A0A8B5Y1U0_9BACI|nr:hypothetical protein FQP34_03480 [Peribacillus simplex]
MPSKYEFEENSRRPRFLPFGGVNTSGMGSYDGIYGFKSFLHEKGVFVQAKYPFRHQLKTRQNHPFAGFSNTTE